ncbi:unnamed protein product [Clonostachys rosea]|uniref:Heterokaryon incompatibility domain-containing protein n=1 Tax=Bionectria ochroleuca TaxID=29856 RepID=A0ABY6UCX3_BIOOC|nr:unnamed protein product [Clonostachys rosea]
MSFIRNLLQQWMRPSSAGETEPTTTAVAGWDPEKGPNVKFARFVNGELVFFNACTREIEYIAVSHVWGDVQFRPIPHEGIAGEFKISEFKAAFVANELPGLVGETAFWMDTLTVNQRDEAEVISVVQAIPRIFQDAIRTLAIRENDGFYPCCEEALSGCDDWTDLSQRLQDHSPEHDCDLRDETYLQRLWTLQEVLLSRTIQFVVSRDSSPKKKVVKEGDPARRFYKNQADGQRLRDDLWVLSYTFCGPGPAAPLIRFANAYLYGGTVSRDNRIEKTWDEDIHTGRFRHILIASRRSATKHYDYIFATMPQFPWYHYPVGAQDMSFGEIFCDLHRQATAAGHGFAARITTSMIDPAQKDHKKGWLPSIQQPEPKCLGDFLRLLGERLPQKLPPNLSSSLHVTTDIFVCWLGEGVSAGAYLTVIETAMKFSENIWRESHVGGELSAYGNFPENDWEISFQDAWRSGWTYDAERTKGPHLIVTEEGDRITVAEGPTVAYKEQRDITGKFPGCLDDDECDEGDDDAVLKQARMILDHMWCAHDPKVKNLAQKHDWEEYCDSMRTLWQEPLLQTMALLAAMIGCQIGLSAAPFVRKHFIPAVVRYPEEKKPRRHRGKYRRSGKPPHCPGAAPTSSLTPSQAGQILAPSESLPEMLLHGKGLEFAQLQKDENGGWLAYLNSSPVGKSLYEQYGFETVRINWFTEDIVDVSYEMSDRERILSLALRMQLQVTRPQLHLAPGAAFS